MRQSLIILSVFASIVCFSQAPKVKGIYSNIMPSFQVTFNQDSTFEYLTNGQHPTFCRWEDFSEKGKWTTSGDTIILNPGLAKKLFVESAFSETENKSATKLLLTFNHIKRWFSKDGNIIKTDTLQIDRLDYSFNEFKKKKLTRVAPRRTTRCTFAGYIPKEIITNDRNISVLRPAEQLKSIFIGCFELQGTKEFIIKDTNSNHLTLNVYSNYYEDGQIRQMKFLIKSDKVLYTKQKNNGEFEKNNFWSHTDHKLKRQKSGS